MRSLLEEFWYGNIFPQKQLISHEEELKELLRLIEKNRTSLAETLTDAQKETLQKYDELFEEMNDIKNRVLFINAFRLGGRFMAEMLFYEYE